MRGVIAVFIVTLIGACASHPGPVVVPDPDLGPTEDAGVVADLGIEPTGDAAVFDAGPVDAGPVDAGAIDAAVEDALAECICSPVPSFCPPRCQDAGPRDAGSDAEPVTGDAGSDAGPVDAVEISAGILHTCARRSSGAVVCWGYNFSGQLGDGTTTNRLTPTPVSGLTDAVELSAGGEHTCARRSSGAVVCWGSNGTGQLGDGTTVDRLTPTAVSGLSDAVEITAGAYHTCARRSSTGAVVCWGANSSGQLGDRTTTGRLIPTAVFDSTGTGIVELSAGYMHTCARRSSIAVVCWGNNNNGELGDGTTTNRLAPTGVSGLSNAVEISAGRLHHTCARRTSGAVECWGYNADGALGDGTTTNRLTPTPVSGLTDAVEVETGRDHTCARRSSGAVVCWGWNNSGVLGDGTTTNRLTPNPVSGLTDAVELSAGILHTCARRSSGAVVCWGSNAAGQLGDSTTTDRLTPTPVVGL